MSPPPFFFAELGGEQVRYLVLPLFLDEAGMTAKVDVKAGVGVMVRMHSDPKEASCVWDAECVRRFRENRVRPGVHSQRIGA